MKFSLVWVIGGESKLGTKLFLPMQFIPLAAGHGIADIGTPEWSIIVRRTSHEAS